MTFLGFSSKLASQNSELIQKNRIGLTHDNDFLVITDRYYTFGLSLNYTRVLNRGIFINTSEQIHFTLLQKAYTPTNIETEDMTEMDRPYAGFLGLETGWSVAKNTSLYGGNILFGLVGPSSGVGQFHQWYHDHIVKYKTPTWVNELPNQFRTNITLQYAKEWELVPNPFGVKIAVMSSAVIGTKDIYFQPELTTYFGRRSILEKSMAYRQINNTEREIYFSLGFGYRWVVKNELLPNEDIKNEIVLFNFNFHHRHHSNEYRVGYHYNTKEASDLERHQYVSLGYAKSF